MIIGIVFYTLAALLVFVHGFVTFDSCGPKAMTGSCIALCVISGEIF